MCCVVRLSRTATGHRFLRPPPAPDLPPLPVSEETVAEHVRKLGVNKGMGPDASPAEVIKSGGMVFVRFLTDIIQVMCRLYYVARTGEAVGC